MREKKVPMRTCVGCTESRDKKDLIRIAVYEGAAAVDPEGRAKGRGIYICRDNSECFDKAIKRKALERALKRSVSEEEKEKLRRELEEARK